MNSYEVGVSDEATERYGVTDDGRTHTYALDDSDTTLRYYNYSGDNEKDEGIAMHKQCVQEDGSVNGYATVVERRYVREWPTAAAAAKLPVRSPVRPTSLPIPVPLGRSSSNSDDKTRRQQQQQKKRMQQFRRFALNLSSDDEDEEEGEVAEQQRKRQQGAAASRSRPRRRHTAATKTPSTLVLSSEEEENDDSDKENKEGVRDSKSEASATQSAILQLVQPSSSNGGSNSKQE